MEPSVLHKERAPLVLSATPHFYNRYDAVSGRTWEGEMTSGLSVQTQWFLFAFPHSPYTRLFYKKHPKHQKAKCLETMRATSLCGYSEPLFLSFEEAKHQVIYQLT